MLIITLQNISQVDEIADYQWSVYVNKSLIAEGQVKGHDRTAGWQKLVSQMLEEAAWQGRRD
jgi:hypothetical protein